MSDNDRRSSRSQVGAFVADIQEGDLVVMPMKGVDGTPIAIGRVNGPFEFDPAQRDEVQKRRPVTWLKTEIQRDVIGPDLLRSVDSSGTVFGLRAHDAARRVLHLAEHGTDPGRGGPEPPPADPDLLGDRLDRAARELLCGVELLREIVELLKDKGQVILYGPPGTGKTYFARRLAWALTDIADDEEYEENGPYSLVQFHPAYSYEDFFEGYRPSVGDDGQMTYQLTPGPLVRLAERAADHPDELHVMVIDEINRANLPRVLGELLYLLEYRDEWTQTQYRAVDGFALPSNLWIIGTMNTADRSIALIDAAMRRRFHFVPFFPDREPTAGLLRRWHEPDQAWIADLLDGVNGRLRSDLGGDHLLIGPSHFLKDDLDKDSVRRIWEYNIEPLIEDQLFGRQDAIDSFRFDAVWKRHGPGADAREAPAEPSVLHVDDDDGHTEIDEDESGGNASE
ncbi:AAA family ATPase [Candidatus Poriferisodalis sp.]|uniref:AAA family ATPase n=1 Tax=Candidatus Poriferisodalis sp. TaxID=3101277 RepID=UPI003B026E8D